MLNKKSTVGYFMLLVGDQSNPPSEETRCLIRLRKMMNYGH